MAGRNFSSPKYVRWRTAVYARDGFCCRLCGSREGLNAHHIKQWSRYPSLRFVVSNGITLCGTHHSLVRGKEEQYAESLSLLVRPGKSAAISAILNKHGCDPFPA